MSLPQLLDPADLAEMYGLPHRALLRIAREQGFLIRVGQAYRIRADEVGELLETCRDRPKVRASTSDAGKAAPRLGSSRTQAASKSQPAQEAVNKLRQRLRSTSAGEPAQVVQLKRAE